MAQFVEVFVRLVWKEVAKGLAGSDAAGDHLTGEVVLEFDADAANPWYVRQGAAHPVRHEIGEVRRAPVSRQAQHHTNRIARLFQRVHEAEANDRFVEFRIEHGVEPFPQENSVHTASRTDGRETR